MENNTCNDINEINDIDEKNSNDNSETINVDNSCIKNNKGYKDVVGIIMFMTFFTFLWAFYNFFIRPADMNTPHLLGGTLFKYPFYIPMIDRDGRLVQELSFDKWALVHIIIYLISGLFFPSNYLCIFILSISCEFFEYFIGARARLSDIVNNLIGYSVGSYLSSYNPIKINIDDKIYECTIISVIVLIISIIALYVNRKVNY
jgi:hypothetical protein